MATSSERPFTEGTPLTPADRDWIRRQARTARALAAEQRRWVQRLDGTSLRRFTRQAADIAKVR